MRERNFDAKLVEPFLHTAVEFAPDGPLADRPGGNTRLYHHRIVAELVDPEDLQRLQDIRLEYGVGFKLIAQRFQDLDHMIGVLAIGDSDLKDIAREILGHVFERGDFAEWHDMNHAS